jgi:glycosyltransferase involved in cell wall biosynthesis
MHILIFLPLVVYYVHMNHLIICLGAVSLLEQCIWLPSIWKIKRLAASLVMFGVALSTGLLIGSYLGISTLLIMALSLYRIINLLRVVENRINSKYLLRTASRTSITLISAQATVFVLTLIIRNLHANLMLGFSSLACLQLALGLIVLFSTQRSLQKTAFFPVNGNYADRDLPTVTVAIPARNETEDLNQCLRSLLASDYPKLELIVLDDCSQERRTAEIIRSFAHDGVQYIAGQSPPKDWLAKNYAYHQLAQKSNGQLILFCGVDMRFSIKTIHTLVNTMLQKNKTMLSVIPINETPSKFCSKSFLVQPMRYAWELSLPRRSFNRPPVLSSCWVISRRTLDEAGGFKAVRRSAVPERFFAKQSSLHTDGYTFMQSSDGTDEQLRSVKSFGEQISTAIRLRYPQLHRRPELICLLSLSELTLFFLPYALLVIYLYMQCWLCIVSVVFIMYINTYFYAQIVHMTYRKEILKAYIIMPLAIIFDVWLLNYSMWRYEFHEVVWKERNVCIPVMHTYSSLPKITDGF